MTPEDKQYLIDQLRDLMATMPAFQIIQLKESLLDGYCERCGFELPAGLCCQCDNG